MVLSDEVWSHVIDEHDGTSCRVKEATEASSAALRARAEGAACLVESRVVTYSLALTHKQALEIARQGEKVRDLRLAADKDARARHQREV